MDIDKIHLLPVPIRDQDGVMEIQVGEMIMDVDGIERGADHPKEIGIMDMDLDDPIPPIHLPTLGTINLHKKGKDPLPRPVQFQRSIWTISTYQRSTLRILLLGRCWARRGNLVKDLNLIRWI
jgi:hypothetical protein